MAKPWRLERQLLELGYRNRVKYRVSDFIVRYVRMACDDRVRIQIVKLARFELIRAADFEQRSIAGFRRLLSAVASYSTERIILITNAGSILACDQRCQRISQAHRLIILSASNHDRP